MRLSKGINGCIVAVICLMNTTAFGQLVSLIQGTVSHNEAERPAIVVSLEPTTKDVESAWKSYLKSEHKIKLNGAGSRNLSVAEEVVFGAISTKTMDFYSRVQEKDDLTELTVFAAFGYDIYINETDMPTEYKALKGVVTTFLNSYLPSHYQEKIDKAEKAHKKLTKKQAKLDKLLTKNAKKIEKLEAQIESAKTESESNGEALKTSSENLDAQKKNLESVLKLLRGL